MLEAAANAANLYQIKAFRTAFKHPYTFALSSSIDYSW